MPESEPTFDKLKRQTLLVFGLVVIGYLALGSGKLIFDNYRVHQDAKRLDAELDQLNQQNLELRSLLAYYRTDSYKEKEARARLGFQKPGERVIVVPVPPGEDTSGIDQSGTEVQAPTPPSNPQQWWNYFFGPRGRA